ncbi:MAG: hypothetical protein QM753_14515 [Thermomicrobiales bacterium]
MFDKLKDAVSDIIGGNADATEKSVTDASDALDKAASQAEGAVESVTGATDGASLEKLSGELSDLVGQAGGLDGIVNELGGLGGILEAVKGVNFPLGADDLEPLLQKAGLPQGIIDQVAKANIGQIDSPDDLIALVKQFLAK